MQSDSLGENKFKIINNIFLNKFFMTQFIYTYITANPIISIVFIYISIK
jgi:hypothetical protein